MGFIEKIVSAMSGTNAEDAVSQDTAAVPDQLDAQPQETPSAITGQVDPQVQQFALPATQEALEQLLEAKRKEWQEGREAEEQERLSNLPEDVRARMEADAKDLMVSDLKAQLLQRDLKDAAIAELSRAGLPATLAGLLNYSDKESMEKSLAILQTDFKACLATAINERLRGRTPEGLGGAANCENAIRDSFATAFGKAFRD